MYHVALAVKCIYGCSNEGGKNEEGKEGRRFRGLETLRLGEFVFWEPCLRGKGKNERDQ